MPDDVATTSVLFRLFHNFTLSALGELEATTPAGFDCHLYDYGKAPGALIAQFQLDPGLAPLEVRYAPSTLRNRPQGVETFHHDADEGTALTEIADPLQRRRALVLLKRLLADRDPGLIGFVLPTDDAPGLLEVLETSFRDVDGARAAVAALTVGDAEDTTEDDRASFQILAEALLDDDLDLLWTPAREAAEAPRVEVLRYPRVPGLLLFIGFLPEESLLQVVAYVPARATVGALTAFMDELTRWVDVRGLLTGPPADPPVAAPFERLDAEAAAGALASAYSAWQRSEGVSHDFTVEELREGDSRWARGALPGAPVTLH